MENPVRISADQPVDEQDDLQKRRRRRMRALRSFLFRLLTLGLVIYVLLFHIVGLTVMPNEDMSPRLDAGDMLMFYRLDQAPKVQDVVVIKKADSGERFVLRVIACPGDTVEVSDENGLSVNGNTLVEPYIYYSTRPYTNGVEYPITLGDDEYFLMADLRNGGIDSRYFGPVRKEEIQGIVITIFRRNNL